MSHQSNLISQDILAYLKQHENKDLLRFLTCGNVDDGKSTLIGRLLYDSKLIYEDQLQAVTRDSKKVGTTGDAPDLALLVDGLQAEREQGNRCSQARGLCYNGGQRAPFAHGRGRAHRKVHELQARGRPAHHHRDGGGYEDRQHQVQGIFPCEGEDADL